MRFKKRLKHKQKRIQSSPSFSLYRENIQPKLTQLSILRMPACICVCCGRPRYRYALVCAYVLVPSENQPLTKLPPTNTEWNRYCSFQRVWNSR